MTPDKVEAALASLKQVSAAIACPDLPRRKRADESRWAATITEALSALTEALAESRRDALAAQEILVRALDYVGNRSDGDLVNLADRAEHWMRGSKILIDMHMKETP